MWARRQDLKIDRVKGERELEIWVLYERRQVGGACMAGCAASARGWTSSGIRAEAGSRRGTREKKARGEAVCPSWEAGVCGWIGASAASP